MAPKIVFVPGFWEGTLPFSHVCTLLQAEGYSTKVKSHPSTGTVSPGNPTMYDDITAIQKTIRELLEADDEVLMVAHSAGGWLGSSALKGLTSPECKEGREGGVVGIVFFAAGIAPLNFKIETQFFTREGGTVVCPAPRVELFNDLDDETAEKWIGELKPHPADGWDGTITYCGWQHVPSVYLVCEADARIPPERQLRLAGMAGSKIVTCPAGHMAQLSMPEKLVEVIKNAAAEFGS